MPKKTKLAPLRMMLSKSAGARFQMDLIELPPFNGYDHMLRVVDHLSKFGYVYPVKTKTSEKRLGRLFYASYLQASCPASCSLTMVVRYVLVLINVFYYFFLISFVNKLTK